MICCFTSLLSFSSWLQKSTERGKYKKLQGLQFCCQTCKLSLLSFPLYFFLFSSRLFLFTLPSSTFLLVPSVFKWLSCSFSQLFLLFLALVSAGSWSHGNSTWSYWLPPPHILPLIRLAVATWGVSSLILHQRHHSAKILRFFFFLFSSAGSSPSSLLLFLSHETLTRLNRVFSQCEEIQPTQRSQKNTSHLSRKYNKAREPAELTLSIQLFSWGHTGFKDPWALHCVNDKIWRQTQQRTKNVDKHHHDM